jgi:exodeoxyribonuclease VII small subunit
MAKNTTSDIEAMSYEQAREELQKVVTELEQQTISLEASMALWERGEALAKHCESWLSGARNKMAQALKDREAK